MFSNELKKYHRRTKKWTKTTDFELLERGSKYAYSLCDVCARSCEELAKAGDKHAKIDAFSRCAEACRTCAKLAKLKRAA
jgi:hypothetical protein